MDPTAAPPEAIHESEYADRTAAWRAVLSRLFPFAIPERAGWKDLPDIAVVLSQVALPPSPHFAVAPGGRSFRLSGAEHAPEAGALDLLTDRGRIRVFPRTLSFEGFGDHGLSYLRLSVRNTDADVLDGPPPLDAHLISRVSAGAVVVLAERSPLLGGLEGKQLSTLSSRRLRQRADAMYALLQAKTVS